MPGFCDPSRVPAGGTCGDAPNDPQSIFSLAAPWANLSDHFEIQPTNALMPEPRFVSAQPGVDLNFALKPSSPAFKLGWETIPESNIGPSTPQSSASASSLKTDDHVGVAYADRSFTVYVSPSGKDSNRGTTAGTAFATVHRAQTAMRAHSGGGTVLLAAGVYFLTQTLTLNASDSGCAYATDPSDAAKGRSAVLSGGALITDWSAGSDGKITAPLPTALQSAEFAQLWVDGARAVRARSPNIGSDTYSRGYSRSVHHYIQSDNTPSGPGFVFNASDIAFRADWASNNATQVLAFGAWTATWYSIKDVDTATNTVHFVENKTQIDHFHDGPGVSMSTM